MIDEKKKIKVLIIDDSALVRVTLTKLLSEDDRIEVIASASDPYQAVLKIKEELPDVITLDLEMPKMDGLTFLRLLMTQRPTPVIVLSTLTQKNSETAMKAWELGAFEVLPKPILSTQTELLLQGEKLRELVICAASSQHKWKKMIKPVLQTEPKFTADAILKKQKVLDFKTTDIVIAIGASTGGTEAIKEVLMGMNAESPGIVIVQHMPEMFTKQFASRLNSICPISVKEAEEGDSLQKGLALIAPGNKHLILKRSGARFYVELNNGPLVNRHRPAVDVLFRSVAQTAGRNAFGVLLTGMGDDGAKGLLEMKNAGAYTIAQDEESSVVFGMPKEAIKLDAALKTLPLNSISAYIHAKKSW